MIIMDTPTRDSRCHSTRYLIAHPTSSHKGHARANSAKTATAAKISHYELRITHRTAALQLQNPEPTQGLVAQGARA